MKKTIFALLACAALTVPALAATDIWKGTLTLTLPQLDIKSLTGDGEYDSLSSERRYSSTDITSSVEFSYTKNDEPFTFFYNPPSSPEDDAEESVVDVSNEAHGWSDNAYVITLSATGTREGISDDYNLDEEVGYLAGTWALTFAPKAFQNLVVNGLDYTDAKLTATISFDSLMVEYSGATYNGETTTVTSNSPITVESYTLSGAKTATAPEPAVAALSLLVLAGLAVRRRR